MEKAIFDVLLLKRFCSVVQVAKSIWLARWTQHAFPLPQPNDKDRIRTFIKMKYIDKVWIALTPSSSSSSSSSLSTSITQSEQNQTSQPIRKQNNSESKNELYFFEESKTQQKLKNNVM
jgi:hypothetical protein